MELSKKELDALGLPFDWHTNANGTADIVTTEPEPWSDRDRSQREAVATALAPVLVADASIEDMAAFITDAMNEYVKTPYGLKQWRHLAGR